MDILIEPNRIVYNYLNELEIHCIYHNRGCHEILQLQHLDSHEATCGYTPAVCTNQGCSEILNQRDFIHHKSEACEFRKVGCDACEEMVKVLENMKNKVEERFTNVEKKAERTTTDATGELEAVYGEVTELKTDLIECFDEMKDILALRKNQADENMRKVRNKSSDDKKIIIVAGGVGSDAVEMFNWSRKTWSPLQSLPERRWEAISFVYRNHLTIAGGYCSESGRVDNMIRMNIDPNPDLSLNWSDCPVKLPAKLVHHSSVLYEHHLIVTGGSNGDFTSDYIHDVKLVPPYVVETLSRMTEPRRNHRTEIFGDNLLIVGGTTTGRYQDNLSSVVLYDIKKNECKQLSSLPYEVSQMAMVRWEDNVVVIGGIDKRGNALNTVIFYNVTTKLNHMLPPMKCKRYGCTAVVIENNIVVLGGMGEQGLLNSVEAFNFERHTWENLPEMSAKISLHTTVVI